MKISHLFKLQQQFFFFHSRQFGQEKQRSSGNTSQFYECPIEGGRMMKYTYKYAGRCCQLSLFVIFLFSLVLNAFLSAPVFAATGDFLFKFGRDYALIQSGWDVAVDSNGDVYVTDYGANTVLVFNSSGTLLRNIGTYGSGNGQLIHPTGIALDAVGFVYVLDQGNQRVQVFSRNGEYQRQWGSSGSGAGQFSNPTYLALDSSGNVYVSDSSNYRVQVFRNDGAFLRAWDGNGTACGRFSYPAGLAVAPTGNVYVADSSNSIKVFSNSGSCITTWGSYGSGDGQFLSPADVALDPEGNVFVVEKRNYRVQKFDSQGNFITKWGTKGGTADGSFNFPGGIASDASGTIYVVDLYAHDVQLFSNSGQFLELWRSGNGSGQFSKPWGIALDPNDNVYVADTKYDRMQVLDSTGDFLRDWTMSPTAPAVDASGNVYVTDGGSVQVFSSDGTPIRSWGSLGQGPGQFIGAEGIAVGPDGNVYVVDSYNARVQVFSSTGTFLRMWGSQGSGDKQFNNPVGITLDKDGNVYVVDSANYRVQVFSSTGDFIRKWGMAGNTDGRFLSPSFVALDADGNVYVADTINRRIQVFDKTGTFLAKWGEYGTGDGQFQYPVGIAVSSMRKVYVVDYYNNNVQVFEGYNGCVVTADAGPGQTVEQTSSSGAWVDLDGSHSTKLGCTDDLSFEWSWTGGSATGMNPTVLLPAGTTNVILTVTSGTKTASAPVSITVQDTQPPSTTALISAVPGTNDWYVSSAAISLTATDLGSGVKEIRYAVDGIETVVTGSAASFTIGAEGAHPVFYFARDNAGNSETSHPLPINIDKTPPAITAVQSPLPNANGWNNTDVTVTFNCSDSVSGVAPCTSPVTVTTEGAGQEVCGTAVDNAGNTAKACIMLNIDKTAPTANISLTPGLLWPPNHKMVNVTPSINTSDSLSGNVKVGLVSATSNEPDNALGDGDAANDIVMNADGSVSLRAERSGKGSGRVYTITYKATDLAGNSTVSSAIVTVPHDMKSK